MASKTPKQKRKRKSHRESRQNQSAANHTVDTRIDQATRLHEAGQLERAKRICCDVIADNPTNPKAWHLLGMTLYSAGAYGDAIECLNQARKFSGDSADLIGHLGVVHYAAGNLDQAFTMLSAVVQADPNNLDSRNNLGVMLLEQGAIRDAQEQFQAVIALDPTFVNARMNLGNCMLKDNRLYDAEELYRCLLQQHPQHQEVAANLGECLRRQGRWEDAIEILTPVVNARSGGIASAITYGRVQLRLGKLQEAKETFEDLLREFPDCSKAMHYLGKTLQSMGRLDDGVRMMRRSLKANPNDPHALCSLGFAMIDSDQRQQARECFSKAVELDPTMSEAQGCLLFLMTGDPSIGGAELFDAHVRWGKQFDKVKPLQAHQNIPNANRKLRIGYASGDLRQHAVASFFEPLLRLKNADQFETFCYHESVINDQVTEKLKALSDHWRVSYGYSDEQIARQVLDDQIDILVDLSGHTSGNRLTAWALKPAPIQISWLGYPNTTGLPAIDYSISCDVQNPTDEPTLHTEQLIRIPGGSFCYTPPANAPAVTDLPALRNGHITFGSLHRPLKISPKSHDLWAAAMLACPTAKLIAFNTFFNERLKSELKDALIKRGIAGDRIEIRNQIEGQSYLETYRDIDIGLDVTPWSGGTTTMEALWMGIPVIAYYGHNRPSRGTAGIIHHLGFPDWIAKSEQEYTSKLRSLGEDLDELARLRENLRNTVTQTIADERRFVRELEQAYRDVWRVWCAQQASPPINLTPSSSQQSSLTT